MPEETAEELATRSMSLRVQGEHQQADELLERAVAMKIADRPADYQTWRPQQVADFFGPILFTGGPQRRFEEIGRASFADMVMHGLLPNHNVLDIGAGALRIGYWLINFLQPGRYHGLEPEVARPRFGLEHLVGPKVAAAKQPRLEANFAFDFTVFGTKFDFYVARSIWTHTTRAQIQTCLDGFVATATPEAVMLASFVPAREGPGYLGDQWVANPLVEHSFEWIAGEAAARGLTAREAGDMHGQRWCRVEFAAAAERPLPSAPTLVPRPAADAAGSLGSRLKRLLRG